HCAAPHSMCALTARRRRTATSRAGWKGNSMAHAKFLFSAAVLVSLGGYAQAQGDGGFTGQQVMAGKAGYCGRCARRPRPNLAGGGDAPGLTGSGFMAVWSKRTTADLYKFIQTSMPAGAPASLAPESYANVTAYLLAANGAKPGGTTLTTGSGVVVGSVAN